MDILDLFHAPVGGPSALDKTLGAVLLGRRARFAADQFENRFEYRDDGSCASFKLACRQSRQLADLLITEITHDLSRFPAAAADMAKLATYAAASTEGKAWWVAVAQRGAFLARLPRLDTLTLQGWPREPDLVIALCQLEDTTQGRLTQLTLRGDGLSEAGISAVQQACPKLRELDITPLSRKYSPAAGAMFRPLYNAEHLTKLVFRHVGGHDPEEPDDDEWRDPALRSLGGMSHLRHLHLHLNGGDTEELLHLSRLRGLRICEITTYDETFIAAADLAGLFAAGAQLTTLSVPQIMYDHPPILPGDLAALALGGDLGAVARLRDHDALALLGALSGLQSLDLGRDFFVDDVAWDALRRLSQLTHLRVGGILALAPDAPCGLPLLQHLDLDQGEEEPIQKPAALLRALLPLLPLPSLVKVGGVMSNGLYLDITHGGGADAAVQAAALSAALRHLAAAPRLNLGGRLCLHACGEPREGEVEVGSLLLLQVAVALRNGLSGQSATFEGLTLSGMHLHGAPWPALHAALPTLQRVKLWDCRLACADVAYLVQSLTSLGQLELEGCTSLGVDECAWAKVAKVVSRPLGLQVHTESRQPALPESVVARCRAEQQEVFGQQFIAWSKQA